MLTKCRQSTKRENFAEHGGGVCTPIGDTKKGKESGNLKVVLVFQVLLASIVWKLYEKLADSTAAMVHIPRYSKALMSFLAIPTTYLQELIHIDVDLPRWYTSNW